ncbi:ketopantoate reductase C-terminal domain-containing protein, partial [Mycolicibacterium elephantis]
LCDEGTVVCALQNGVEQVARVGPHCPTATVVPAVLWFSAEPHPEGGIWLRTAVRIVLPANDAASRVADVFRGSSATVELDPDFVTEAWRKLLVNALAGLMVLSGRRSGMFRRADVATLSRRYLAECLAVAQAEGAKLGAEVIEETVSLFANVPEDLTTSMLTDREANRPLEWDIRNGVIRRKAAEHGIATPISDVVVPLLAAASDGPG